MSRTVRAIVAVVGVVLLASLASLSLAGEAKGPKDFDYKGGDQGKVTFSHEKHAGKNPKCTDCHVKVFKMKMGTTVPDGMKMAAMEGGQFCGACHNGQASFSVKDKATCNKCHVKG